jgi:hypothetical protein
VTRRIRLDHYQNVTNPSTSRPLFGGIPPPFNPIPPSNPLFASLTQPSWLLGRPQTSYTHTKTEVKREPGIKVEDEGEDRDDKGPAITVRPGPSDPDRILTASDELWYTHMPSLSPNDDILNVHTPMPTPPRSPEYPHFYDYQEEPLTAEEAEQELDNDPMWHWPGYWASPHYNVGPTARQQNDRSPSQSPHSGEEAMPQPDHEETPIPGLRWLDDDDGNLIDRVATYIADANEAMEQEGRHGDEEGQETAWGQGRQGSPNFYLETRTHRYKRDV